MRILAKNYQKCVSLEPNIVWKRLVPFFEVVSSQKNDFASFCPFLASFWHFFALFDIFVNFFHFFTLFSDFWNLAIMCNFLTFFAIFYHFWHLFALFGEYAFECILKHLNTLLAVSAHCINFLSVLAISISHFFQFLANYQKLCSFFCHFQ